MKGNDLEGRLWRKANAALAGLQGRRREEVVDIFERRLYVRPTDLLVDNYLRPVPLAAFNPGAILLDGDLVVFPRLLFDYYGYTSSIGAFRLPIEDVLAGRVPSRIRTQIVLWPIELWEFGPGCEDPRVMEHGGELLMLYTAARRYDADDRHEEKAVQALAVLSRSWEVRRRGYFAIDGGEGKFVPDAKDSALLAIEGGRARLLWRPHIRGLAWCWRGEVDLESYIVPEDSLAPVLVPERWELRVGWSTNALEVEGEGYLVGWHGVSRRDQAYRNGLALVDREGWVKRISDYLLAPRGLCESYGDRPHVIFGNGLIRYRDLLLWVGGISDYAIGIFSTPLERALVMLR
ncbi:hypothetical protein DRJ54_03225 [Candidatus Acetothermia bacterium]|nr:MAG: hypothetical protein DRJ54_03225 [Candidatus Acetothermia bacterium]